jgi:hypothetical protein
VPPVIAAAEVARIAQIGYEWIERFERPRPPFTVVAVEEKSEVTLAGSPSASSSTASMRSTTAPLRSSTTRPAQSTVRRRGSRAAHGRRSSDCMRLRCAIRTTSAPWLIARLKAGDIDVLGIAEDHEQWKALLSADGMAEPGNWRAIEAWWATRLPEIAAEFRDGVASVTPRDAPACCRSCRLQPLCRIEESIPGTGEGTP